MDHVPTLEEMRDRTRHARALGDRHLREAMLASVMADAIALAIAAGHLAGSYEALMRLGFERHEVFRYRDAAMRIMLHRLAGQSRRGPCDTERRLSAALARELGLTESGPFGDEPPRPLPRSPGLAEMVERITRTLAGGAAITLAGLALYIITP